MLIKRPARASGFMPKAKHSVPLLSYLRFGNALLRVSLPCFVIFLQRNKLSSWSSLKQTSSFSPSVGDIIAAGQVQRLKVLETGEFLQSCIGDLIATAEAERLEMLEGGELL